MTTIPRKTGSIRSKHRAALRALTLAATSAACTLGCAVDASEATPSAEAVGATSSAFTAWPSQELPNFLTSIDSDNIAVAVDPGSDDLHIALVGTTVALGRRLFYGVRHANGVWDGFDWIAILDSQGFAAGTSVSITVDRDHFAHILYNHVLHDGLVYRGQLRHIAAPFFQVDEDVVEDSATTNQLEVGSANAITADSAGDLHIAYISKDNGTGNAQLTYAHQVWTGEQPHWRKDVIVPYSAGNNLTREVDLAVDANKKPHIVFRDSGAGALAYVKNDGTPTAPNWNRDTVLGGLSNDFFTSPSIAVGSAGVPTIGFISQTKAMVGLARLVGTTWNIEKLNSYSGAGRTWVSLAFESGTIEQLTYFNASDTSLKFFRREAAGWNGDMVDNSADTGRKGASVVDSHGKPHVIYYDATSKKLRHATAVN